MQYEVHQGSFSPTSRNIYCRIFHHATDTGKDLCCISDVCHYVLPCRWDNDNISHYRMHGVCRGIKKSLSIWIFYVGWWNCLRFDIITRSSDQAIRVIRPSILPFATSVRQSVSPSIRQSVVHSVCPSVRLSRVHPFLHQFLNLPTHLI